MLPRVSIACCPAKVFVCAMMSVSIACTNSPICFAVPSTVPPEGLRVRDGEPISRVKPCMSSGQYCRSTGRDIEFPLLRANSNVATFWEILFSGSLIGSVFGSVFGSRDVRYLSNTKYSM